MPSPTTTLRLSLALSLQAAMACASAAPPPIENFFGNPVIDSPVLSPNGRYVALRLGEAGKRKRLGVIDVASNTMSNVSFGNGDVGQIQWVNNNRIVFNTTDLQSALGDLEYNPGLFAIDRDGKNFLQLVDRVGDGGRVQTGSMIKSSRQLPWHTALLSEVGRQDSDEIYVANRHYDQNGEVTNVKLVHLNTRTGKAVTLVGPPNTRHFLLDHDGEPRLAITVEREQQAIHHRGKSGAEWRKLAQFPVYKGQAGSFEPLAFGPDGILFVETTGGKDKSSVHTYDLASAKISPEPIVETEGYDFAGELVVSGGKFLGLQVITDAAGMVWIDPKMNTIQKEIDTRLSATVNLVSVAARPELPVVLVTAYSDVQPVAFLLYNTETKAFTRLGSTYPDIQPGQMGRQEPVRYSARDGLEIPALLTLPPGGKRNKLPLLVMVHGGPHIRAAVWGWNPETQFLATRGYAVLEPDFRGSTGYGNAHFRAGWKQWGLGMQNDIADAVKWAVAKGIADPERVCIAGASYGGYAALMGLVNDPGLYKCAISWAAVTDIELLLKGDWGYMSDLSSHYRRYGMPETVGDPVADAVQFRATSPLQQAARIDKPLLLAHGSADRRVPLYHGEKFRDAGKKTNPNVEWIKYEAEGHGWALPENRIDFWTRVEKFLGRHIGQP